MIRRPPRSTLFPTRRSSDLRQVEEAAVLVGDLCGGHGRHSGSEAEKGQVVAAVVLALPGLQDRKSTRLNSSHLVISYAVFCLKKKNTASPLCVPTLTCLVLR